LYLVKRWSCTELLLGAADYVGWNYCWELLNREYLLGD
jgi:hypothetical protein